MNLHMHTKVVGSGFHIPFDAHVDSMFPAGKYDILQLKDIWEPSPVLWEISRDWTEPFSGREGTPQPTGKRENLPIMTSIMTNTMLQCVVQQIKVCVTSTIIASTIGANHTKQVWGTHSPQKVGFHDKNRDSIIITTIWLKFVVLLCLMGFPRPSVFKSAAMVFHRCSRYYWTTL